MTSSRSYYRRMALWFMLLAGIPSVVLPSLFLLDEYRARLSRRAEELITGLPVEVVRERLALEVAVFAERSDVEEELVRLRSHLDKAGELLDAGGGVGRKLDFLLQEMNRETNTVGSKASDAEISPLVIEIKAELEKIREQIQNLE